MSIRRNTRNSGLGENKVLETRSEARPGEIGSGKRWGAPITGRRLGGEHDGDKSRRKKRRNRRTMGSGAAQRRPNSAVAEDLAGRAEALLSAGGAGWLLRLAQAGGRLGKFQRNPAQHMMVQHEHHQQVELHHRQQPGGCPSPPSVFQYAMHDVLSGPYRVLRLASCLRDR